MTRQREWAAYTETVRRARVNAQTTVGSNHSQFDIAVFWQIV
jgi:hypothetical protein